MSLAAVLAYLYPAADPNKWLGSPNEPRRRANCAMGCRAV